jgi:serine protease Do
MLAAALVGSRAETVLLKDKAAITGKILAEKRDQVVVDVGYAVLSVPRSAIVKIQKEAGPEKVEKTGGKAVAAAGVEIKGGLYSQSTSSLPEKTVRELVQQLGGAVVQVRTPGGMGSGFILNEEGYLVTNFHVIEGETQISIEIFLQKGEQLERKAYKKVRIVAMNKFDDLALLKIEDADAVRLPRVLLGESEPLAVGERVFAIGSPLGLERTVTEGIISTKTREMQGKLYLQTTTQINPGNSGGPLFNQRGEVVGVTNMKITLGEGLGFAIPVEQLRYFLDHRDAFAYDNDNPSNPYRYLQPPSRMSRRAD